MKKNMLLNAIKGIMSLMFPLITFPYISRVLGVVNIGRVNFSNSVVSYFILLGGFGITSYATREGSRTRHNRDEFNQFANEVFSINIVTAILAYILLFAITIRGKDLHEYAVLIFIYSITIAFNVLSVEWVYTAYEEYAYIALRSIIFQIVSIALMFLLVRDKSEFSTCMYVSISVIANAGAGILNFTKSRKYCHIHLVTTLHLSKHFKSMLIFFGTALISTIFVSSDTTILGLLCGDKSVGIYSVAVRIYTIVKTLLTSLIMVSVPKLSELYLEQNNVDFKKVSEDVLNILVTFLLPAMVGIVLMRKEIVCIISGNEYLASSSPLAMLSIALIFSVGSLFYGQCILIPCKKESINLYAAIICAVANVALNFVLIPRWAENAAAFTTVVAEAIGFFLFWYNSRKLFKYPEEYKTVLKVMVGCLGIVIVCFAIKSFVKDSIICLMFSISMSVLVYLLIEILCKNQAVYDVLKDIKSKVMRK